MFGRPWAERHADLPVLTPGGGPGFPFRGTVMQRLMNHFSFDHLLHLGHLGHVIYEMCDISFGDQNINKTQNKNSDISKNKPSSETLKYPNCLLH